MRFQTRAVRRWAAVIRPVVLRTVVAIDVREVVARSRLRTPRRWAHDGSRERKIVDFQIWSLPQLMDNLLVMQKVLKEMRAMQGQPKLVQAAGMH